MIEPRSTEMGLVGQIGGAVHLGTGDPVSGQCLDDLVVGGEGRHPALDDPIEFPPMLQPGLVAAKARIRRQVRAFECLPQLIHLVDGDDHHDPP